MPYLEASYHEVCLWCEDTLIKYVPQGKKAGTMSYDRYERYSQGNTVGEALALGSKPLDLVHDFEKSLLKRVGGPLRDAPLNLAEVADGATLTKTDMVIARWGYMFHGKQDQHSADAWSKMLEQKKAYRQKQLAAKHGVKSVESLPERNSVENPSQSAQRARAHEEATAILEDVKASGRKVTDDDVLRVLRLWSFKKSGDRKSVMPAGVSLICSETVGFAQWPGGNNATLHASSYPKFMTLLAQWMKDNRPEGHTQDFVFTTVQMNAGFASKRHRDSRNLGPTVVKAFGDFQGGRLHYWSEDDKRHPSEALRAEDCQTLDVRAKRAFFDGNRAHEVEAYEGEERFSLVFFTGDRYQQAKPEDQEQIVQAGFPWPDEESLAHFKGMLEPPKGYASYVERPKDSKDDARKKAALSMIRGFSNPKKKGLLGSKLMAARLSGIVAAAQEKEEKENAGGDANSGDAPKVSTKALSTDTVQRMLAKVALKRQQILKEKGQASAAPGGGVAKKIGKKPLAMGGLLARVQSRSQPSSELAASGSADSEAGNTSQKEGGAAPAPAPQPPTAGGAAVNMKAIAALAKIRLAGKEALGAPEKKKKGGLKALAPLGGLLARVQSRARPGEEEKPEAAKSDAQSPAPAPAPAPAPVPAPAPAAAEPKPADAPKEAAVDASPVPPPTVEKQKQEAAPEADSRGTSSPVAAVKPFVKSATPSVTPMPKKRGMKPLAPVGGLLARVQKRALAPADEQAAPSTPATVASSSTATAASTTPPPSLADVKKLADKLKTSSAESASSAGTSAAPSPVAAGGVTESASEASPASPAPTPKETTSAAPKSKGQALKHIGGLLSRVQKRLPQAEEGEETPSPTAENADTSKDVTPIPARKRPRTDGEQEMSFSSKKLEKPASFVKNPAADADKMQDTKDVASIEKVTRPSGFGSTGAVVQGDFLSFASACCSSEEQDATAVLTACLRKLIASAGESVLGAVVKLLTAPKVVDGKVLAKAISEAFDVPCQPNLHRSALAALAVDGRHRKLDLKPATPLTVKEVADVLSVAGGASDENDAAVKSLASILVKTRVGMEPSFLILALQGQLTPCKDAVPMALAKAMMPETA